MSDLKSNVQLKLLSMLEWYHNFCNNHNLRYYIVGGTMLGAIRHQGFIPWDDDIDVAMPREDYEELLKLTNNYNKEKYIVESIYSGNEDFIYPYAKLYDTSTTLIENTRYCIKRGIYIDIFPLDGIGNTMDQAKSNYLSIQRRINFLSTRICALNKERKFYKNAAIIISRLIPKFIVSETRLIKAIDSSCKKYKFEASNIVGNLVGNWGERELMERFVFGRPKLYKFENLMVFGVENYDAYLSSLYGYYMVLPPENKRKSHHNYIKCDLYKSYK